MRGRKHFAITTIPKRRSISRTASPSMSQAGHDRHDNRIGSSRKSSHKRSESPVVGNREGIALPIDTAIEGVAVPIEGVVVIIEEVAVTIEGVTAVIEGIAEVLLVTITIAVTVAIAEAEAIAVAEVMV